MPDAPLKISIVATGSQYLLANLALWSMLAQVPFRGQTVSYYRHTVEDSTRMVDMAQ